MVTPIDIQVTNKVVTAIAEEMGIVLQKAAMSSNIKERRDFSCALFDSSGNMLSQAAHIPVHLGAMPMTVKALKTVIDLGPGDVVITNDPFKGGTHLPDITLMSGVFAEGASRPLFYLLTRAHHADVGGMAPGSMALTRRLVDEGVLIEPALLKKGGEQCTSLIQTILKGVRNPEERKGDLQAQLASLARGEERLKELIRKEGLKTLYERVNPLLDYGERVMKSLISSIPDGEYAFEDFLDDDGIGNSPVPLRCRLIIDGSTAVVDYTESADQVESGLNTVKSVTASATYYVFFCMIGSDYPINGGSLRPITVKTRPGSLLDAQYPAPVAAGNVETSQRIVDTLLGALAKAVPELVPAASCGTMNNIAIGGTRPDGTTFTYYETIGGGMGASKGHPGLSGVHTHMTNTLNTPIEALEQSYPFMVELYSLRNGSGGKGLYPGGDGVVRRYKFLQAATVSLLTERRRLAPYGLEGGESGQKGANLFIDAERGTVSQLPGKGIVEVKGGDAIEIRTPGGGGWGARLDTQPLK